MGRPSGVVDAERTHSTELGSLVSVVDSVLPLAASLAPSGGLLGYLAAMDAQKAYALARRRSWAALSTRTQTRGGEQLARAPRCTSGMWQACGKGARRTVVVRPTSGDLMLHGLGTRLKQLGVHTIRRAQVSAKRRTEQLRWASDTGVALEDALNKCCPTARRVAPLPVRGQWEKERVGTRHLEDEARFEHRYPLPNAARKRVDRGSIEATRLVPCARTASVLCASPPRSLVSVGGACISSARTELR